MCLSQAYIHAYIHIYIYILLNTLPPFNGPIPIISLGLVTGSFGRNASTGRLAQVKGKVACTGICTEG